MQAWSETFARLGMPNGKGSSSRADVAIITHMEDVDRYRESPGEGATALQSAGRVSIAPDVREKSVDERADCVMTLALPEECCTKQRRRHKCSCAVSPQQRGALSTQSLVDAASPRRTAHTEGSQAEAEGSKKAVL